MTHHFIDHLQALAKAEDRGALAALRRGLGQPPGSVAEMYRYVVPHLPKVASQEAVCYLIAPLFALHSKPGGSGNLGASLRQCDPDGKNSDALERRFTALLASHSEDLPGYLRQAVSFLKSKEIAIDWNELFRDLQKWDDEDRRVQKDWANAFWRRMQVVEETGK